MASILLAGAPTSGALGAVLFSALGVLASADTLLGVFSLALRGGVLLMAAGEAVEALEAILAAMGVEAEEAVLAAIGVEAVEAVLVAMGVEVLEELGPGDSTIFFIFFGLSIL